MNKGAINSSLISTYLHTIIQHLGTMRTSHMAEEQYMAQDMGRITSKGIGQQGSSSSKEKAEMNIRVKRGPSFLKRRYCSSWGITRS